MRADPLAHAGHQVADSLWGGQDIERRGQSALVIKVAKPQFGPSKLPLLVLVILQKSEKTNKSVERAAMWERTSTHCSSNLERNLENAKT